MPPLDISRHDPTGNAQVRRIQKRVIYSQITLILSFRINEDSVSGNAALDMDGTR